MNERMNSTFVKKKKRKYTKGITKLLKWNLGSLPLLTAMENGQLHTSSEDEPRVNTR